MTARLHGSLQVEEVTDAQGRTVMREGRAVWRLLEPLIWCIGGYNGAVAFTVPAGFVTDLASVPLLARWAIPASGPWQRAAVIHDWLYVSGGVGPQMLVGLLGATEPEPRAPKLTRTECDAIFLDAMAAAEVNIITRYAMWAAVRCFGCTGWGK